MNILFFTLVSMNSISERGIYPDLLRKFVDEGHFVYVVCPSERRSHEGSRLIKERQYQIIKVSTLNIQKTNKLEKGIGTLLIEPQFIWAIKHYFGDIKFDAAIYSTPPITFSNVIKYIKKNNKIRSYLLLKDIFPQNAIDLELFSEKSLIAMYFRCKEKRLYNLSDSIGCMSQANVDYLLRNNFFLGPSKVHISPNSVELKTIDTQSSSERKRARVKYGFPVDSKVFIYGGNLGKPQDIPFIISCLKQNENKIDRFFVICGIGTEYAKLEKYVNTNKPTNILLINGLSSEEYATLVSACDIGLIFLDHRFTIPNFPSRILSYMQNAMPILACTDVNTDVGKIIQNAKFGWWCESTNPNEFTKLVDIACTADITEMKKNSYEFLVNNYTVDKSYKTIINSISEV